MHSAESLYGLMAEFASPERLLDAARSARNAGYRAVEAYSPISVEGLAEILGFRSNRIALATLLGGIAGGAGGYILQWYSAVVDYPINAGGRPLHSWPAFIPATFELTVLGAALAAFAAFVLLNGLPRLNHPVFNAPDFDLASRSRFFLCIRATDALFDVAGTAQFLRDLAPIRVAPVPLEESS